MTEEVILEPAYKTEPPTGENKSGFEKLMASLSVTVFFWFILFMFPGRVILIYSSGGGLSDSPGLSP